MYNTSLIHPITGYWINSPEGYNIKVENMPTPSKAVNWMDADQLLNASALNTLDTFFRA